MLNFNPYRKILIETLNNEWITESCYSAATGFRRIGHNVIRATKDEILTLAKSTDIVVHGSIPTIHAVFQKLGIRPPQVHLPVRGFSLRE